MNKTAQQKRLISVAIMAMLAGGLSGCADDASNLGGGTTTGGTTTGGTTTSENTTGNTTAGNTSGGTTTGSTTGGGATTGDTTGGSTGGTTTGTTTGGGATTGDTTGGSTGGTTTGGTTTGGTTTGGTTTGGTTTGGDIGGIVCNPLSDTFRPILASDGATATGAVNGLCIGCSVGNPDFAIDGDITTTASLNTPVGLLGGSSQLLVDAPTLFPANRRAGFVIFDPAGALLTATLLQTVTVSALNNGVVQDSADFSTLTLDLLGTPIIGSTQPTFANFVPTQPFNELRIEFGSTVNALAQLGVVQACVSVNDAILP